MTYHIYILNVLIYIHISEYVRTMSLIFPSIFSIYQDAYVNVNSLYIKFLYNFFLPDVASASITAFTIISFVLSVPLPVVEDYVADKV